MNESDTTFATNEHAALREEILFLIKQSYITENSVVLGTAALYAWVFTNSSLEIPRVVWWIPVLVAILGGIREIGIRSRVAQIGRYIMGIEKNLRSESKLGWEHYLANVRKNVKGKILGITSGLFWGAFLVTTVIIAILMQP
jgi:hypothetical protein